MDGLQFLALTQPNPRLPLFIFLPGMDGSPLSMHNQRAELRSTFDLRCLSIPKNDLTPWQDFVDRVVAHVKFERHCYPNRPIYLCGESFGGCLALQVITHAPKLFAGLVVVNGASSLHRLFWQSWISAVVKQMSVPLYQLAANILLPLLLDIKRVTATNREALLNAIQTVTPESAAWRLSLLCNAQVEERSLQRFTAPTILIASQRDQLLPSVIEAQRLAPYFSCVKIVTLMDSSHACLLEKDISLNSIFKQTKFFADFV